MIPSEPDLIPSQKDSPNSIKQGPNIKIILLLGILSIAFCWFYAIPGITMGVIAYTLAKNAENFYSTDEKVVFENTLKVIKNGKLCATIGTVLSGIFLCLLIIKYIVSFFSN